MDKFSLSAVLAAALALSACQSAKAPGAANAMADTNFATTPSTVTAAAAPPGATATAYAATPPAAAGQCAMPIAGGPPPKPAKGADFAKNAVGNNIKRNVGRNAISMLGGQIAGPLGGAVAQGIAVSQIRTEQDLKGKWTVTDGRSDCGCELDISSGVNLQMKSSNAGTLKPLGCASPLLAGTGRWTLGHSFTGYDVPLTLLGPDRRTVMATLNRDGINYFSGRLADGTPVTLWRRGG